MRSRFVGSRIRGIGQFGCVDAAATRTAYREHTVGLLDGINALKGVWVVSMPLFVEFHVAERASSDGHGGQIISSLTSGLCYSL